MIHPRWMAADRRGGRPWLAALLLAFAGLCLVWACAKEAAGPSEHGVPIRIQLRFPEPTAAPLASPSAAGVAEPQRAARAAAALESLVVIIRDPESGEVAASLALLLTSGQTEFEASLSVPPADAYDVDVRVVGTRGSADTGLEHGGLYHGIERLVDVRPRSTPRVDVEMQDIVPLYRPTTRTATGYIVEWRAVPAAVSYVVRAIPDGGTASEAIVESTRISIVAAGRPALGAAPTVAYRVRAFFGRDFYSAYSESLRVDPNEPPARVADLAIAEITADSMRLEWTASGDDGLEGRADAYDLRWSLEALDEQSWDQAERVDTPPPLESGAVESFWLDGLPADRTIFVALRVLDEAGNESPLSNVASGATTSLPPDAPTDLRIDALTVSSVSMHWVDQATNETSYRVERRRENEPDFTSHAILGPFAGTGTYVDEKLLDQTVYRYRVRAENAAGVSDYSNFVVGLTAIIPPSNVQVTPLSATALRVSWDYPLRPVREFFVARRAENAWVDIAHTDSTQHFYEDTGLAPATLYTYRITTSSRAEASDPSEEASGTTLALAPLCELTEESLDFGVVTLGESRVLRVHVRNAGGPFLDGLASLAACNDPAFSIAPGSVVSFDLDAGDTTSIQIRFAPTVAGVHACDGLSLGAGCPTVPFSGEGEAPPLCAFGGPPMDFATVRIGDTSIRRFTMKNLGGGLLVGSASLASCADFTFPDAGFKTTFDYALGAGETTDVQVRFAPQEERNYDCAVEFTGGCAGQTFPILAQSIGVPICQLSTETLEFGEVDVGETKELSFNISNVGFGVMQGTVQNLDHPHWNISSGAGDYALSPGDPPHVVTVEYGPDAAGFHNIDIATGCEVSVHCTGNSINANTKWWGGFAGIGLGAPAPQAQALEVWNERLVVGGVFNTAGSFDVPNIAFWNGTAWSPIGGSTLGPVNALEAVRANTNGQDDDNDGTTDERTEQGLVVGGNFPTMNNVVRLAPTEPNFWVFSPLGAGVNDQVSALGEFPTSEIDYDVVAGGFFSLSGGVSCNRVGRFTGNLFSPLTPPILTLPGNFLSWNNSLYAVGSFNTDVSYFARWNGTSWVQVGGGISGPEGSYGFGLGEWNGQLVIGGSFNLADGQPVRNIVLWDGTSYHPLGSGIDGPVFAIASYHGDLIAGGLFLEAGGVFAANIARWDGTKWHRMGDGANNAVFALAVFQNSLYVGGRFTQAGDKSSVGIARWDD